MAHSAPRHPTPAGRRARPLVAVFAAGAALWLLTASPLAALDTGPERILTYDAVITVNADGSLLVTETIKVRANGEMIRHGIFRTFPTIYNPSWLTRRTVPFEVVETTRDGQPEEFHTDDIDNGVAVYLGKRHVVLSPGEFTYKIVYRTDRQMRFFDDHDELYWNVTGNNWDFAIEAASADAVLPAAFSAEQVQLEAYTGPAGAKGQDYTAKLDTAQPTTHAYFATTQPLDRYDGLTIVVSFPKGVVPPPSALSNAWHFCGDNPWLVILALTIPGLILYYLVIWVRVGIDPKGRTIIPQFEAPPGVSAAGCRYLWKMGYDHTGLAATILSLAAKGCVKIRNDADSYTVTRTEKEAQQLSPEELGVLETLGAGEVTFSSTYNPVVKDLSAGVDRQLKDQHQPQDFRTNGGYLAIGCLGSLVSLGVLFLIGFVFGAEQAIFTLVIELAVLLPINIIFGRLIRAYTPAGRERLDRVLGLRLYLGVAEKDRLNLANQPKETPALFEKFLPYALALGVENQWAERFADMFARLRESDPNYRPSWYESSGIHAFQAATFAHSMSTMSSSIGSASLPPSSSSGSSSGGGGGGSSGGGGGGGGGGGW